MLTVAQAARLLELQPVTIRAWIHRGRLRRQPDGRIAAADLLEAWETRDTRMLALATAGHAV